MSEVRILLVEDNADDELLTLRALKKGNFANPVTVARDGAEALELLIGSRAMPFGLILLDLRLPKIHGLEVLQRIRADERTKLVRVVLLTSSAEEPDIKLGYTYGASGYVRKPVDFQEFQAMVVQLGMYWLVINQLPPEARFVDRPANTSFGAEG
jgi:two-component system response regulator